MHTLDENAALGGSVGRRETPTRALGVAANACCIARKGGSSFSNRPRGYQFRTGSTKLRPSARAAVLSCRSKQQKCSVLPVSCRAACAEASCTLS